MLQRIGLTSRKICGVLARGSLLSRLFRLPVSEGAVSRPGLILIQIDGLSQEQFNKGLEKGRLPFLRRLIRREHYVSRQLYSGLPATTPAVQAELFYGARTAVPAFAFVDRNTAEMKRMYQPEVAFGVEAELQRAGAQGLLAGGSSYCNIYAAGAEATQFCASTLNMNSFLSVLNPLRLGALILTNLMSVLRLVALLPVELVLALWDLVRGVADGRSFIRELKFVPVRVTVSILLREICVIGTKIDISRGMPIVHLNLFGYDEQSHRRGPDSLFATWSLKGIDYAVKRVWRDAMRAQRRHYEVWIYSDHGQCAATPYHRVAGYSLPVAVAQAWSLVTEKGAPANSQTEAGHRRGPATYTGHYGVRWLWPAAIRRSEESDGVGTQDHFRIAALGPVGFIYMQEPMTEDAAMALAQELVHSHKVPVALTHDVDGKLVAFTPDGRFLLPEDIEALCGPDHPCLEFIREDLAMLCQHRNAGDITLLGWRHGGQPLTFATESGSHAGISPQETCAFALLPQNAPLELACRPRLRPADIRQSALALLGRLSATDEDRPANEGREIQRDLIRVMTYNVHSCIGTDGKLAPERVARLIAQYEPDVVALQELDAGRQRTGGHDQAELIAEFLQMQYYFHPAIHVEEERYGDAILTRLPERLVRTGILPRSERRPDRELRGALWVEVDFNGSQIQIINTHLGISAEERYLQTLALTGEEWLGHEDARGPLILCGDLNSFPNSRPWHLLNSQLSDVQLNLDDHRPRATFHSRLPRARIDHVFVSPDFTVASVVVPRSYLSRVASDHLPLIVDLRLT